MVDETTVTERCSVTGKPYSVTVKAADLKRYSISQDLIQDVFPYLSPGDREFIKTRISPEGWNQMFNEE
jgi:hypothetical protein